MFVWLFFKLKVCEKTKTNIRLFVACLDKRCFLQDPLSGAGEFVLLEGSKLGCYYRLEAAIRVEQGTDVGLRVNVQNGLMWNPPHQGEDVHYCPLWWHHCSILYGTQTFPVSLTPPCPDSSRSVCAISMTGFPCIAHNPIIITRADVMWWHHYSACCKINPRDDAIWMCIKAAPLGPLTSPFCPSALQLKRCPHWVKTGTSCVWSATDATSCSTPEVTLRSVRHHE